MLLYLAGWRQQRCQRRKFPRRQILFMMPGLAMMNILYASYTEYTTDQIHIGKLGTEATTVGCSWPPYPYSSVGPTTMLFVKCFRNFRRLCWFSPCRSGREQEKYLWSFLKWFRSWCFQHPEQVGKGLLPHKFTTVFSWNFPGECEKLYSWKY